MPRAVILTWQRRLLDLVKASRPIRELSGPAAAVLELSSVVGFAHLPIGAPVAGIVVEELSAAGVEVIVGIGTAGGLAEQPITQRHGLCSAALRDLVTGPVRSPVDTAQPGRYKAVDGRADHFHRPA